MHMADALVSPAVAVTAGVVAATLIAVASRQVKRSTRDGLTSMMGVLGAFVFAAQMINFTIPGTGSSGHIIGGVLLSAILGPWAGFLTICSVLIVQCLVFADGGLMALGCNILNMGVISCLVAYPLVYKPIVTGGRLNAKRLSVASIAACTVSLLIGAFLVTLETEASGITALPFGTFLGVMLPIHAVIGACEGVATALVLVFVLRNSPSMISYIDKRVPDVVTSSPDVAAGVRRHRRITLWVLGIAALVLAVAFTWIASSNPDGLEWSISRVTGHTELAPAATPATAVLPDYDSYFAGIIGAVIVMTLLWAVTSVIFRRRNDHTAL